MATKTYATTYRIFINARPEAVFAYVADLLRHGEWSGGPLRIEALSAGPVAVGQRYRSVGRMLGKDNLNELCVTAYQPPTRFCFSVQDPAFGELTHEFTVRPDRGGTLLERTITSQMSPAMALLFGLVLKPLIAQPMMAKAFQKLKARLEQRQAAPIVS